LNTNADSGRVILQIEAGVASVVFDRPQARNAMTWDMYQQLATHCTQIAQDPTVRAVVFRGAGGQAFVAGTDIEQFTAFRTGEDGVAYERRIEAGIAQLCALPMPTVALVEGWCVGGGLAIATACDFRPTRSSACPSRARWATAFRSTTWHGCARPLAISAPGAC
jgi:enoyl-CoA hydratase/carnithine racemase